MEENKIKEYYNDVIMKTISQKDIEEYDHMYSLRVIQDAISDFTKERKQINFESTSSQILLARYIFDRLQRQ